MKTMLRFVGSLSVRKRFLVCALLWVGSVLGAAKTKPILIIDLLARGMPPESSEGNSYKTCPYQYRGYRSVRWLDAKQILVAFNTSPDCAKKEGILSGALRLVTFDLNGGLQHSADISYDAGDGIAIRLIQHDGIWVGPGRTVIVEIPGSHLKAQPTSRDKIAIFSPELSLDQEIETDSHQIYYDGMHFAGVTADHEAIRFWTSDGRGRKCLLFSGTPLKQTGTCSRSDVDMAEISVEYRQSAQMPKSCAVIAFAGRSTDGGTARLFAVNDMGTMSGFCELFGRFCPSHGELIVFDTATNRLVFNMRLPLAGRAALSPTGKHLAVLENNRVEIFSLS